MLLLVCAAAAVGPAPPPAAPQPIIVVHGGAWAVPDSLRDASLQGVKAAAEAGFAVLESSGSALDAVEAAVRSLEADPSFDAGRGAVLNAAGGVELDAVIMDGFDLSVGAVAALGPVLHPVSVARLVRDSDHVLLVGQGATEFAREHGVPILKEDDLVTPAARQEWAEMAAYPNTVKALFSSGRAAEQRQSGHDTVGAVALDARGNLAAATSTGGITFKRVGRVGDSPIVGAGVLADNTLGAASTTGHGESIMRYMLADRALQRLAATAESGCSPGEACSWALEGMLSRVDGCGGVICLSPSGEPGVAFSTRRMPWAVRRTGGAGGLRYGIDRAQGNGGEAGDVEVVDTSAAVPEPTPASPSNSAVLEGVAQLTGSMPLVISDEDEGSLIYLVPSLLDATEAEAIFVEMAPWGGWRREADDYGPQDRRTAYFADDPCTIFSYVGLVCKPSPWLPSLAKLRDRVNAAIAVAHGTACTACLANEYGAGAGAIAWHGDEVRAHGDAKLVVSVSTGGERVFYLRHRQTQRTIRVPLPPGSALVMSGEAQSHWEHSLPLEPGAPHRISFTFRSIVSGYEADREPPHL